MPIPVLGLRDHTKVFKDGSCLLTDDSFVLVGSFVAFFIPLTIMVVTYFLTISALQTEATLYLNQLVPRPFQAFTQPRHRMGRRRARRDLGGLAVKRLHYAVDQQ